MVNFLIYSIIIPKFILKIFIILILVQVMNTIDNKPSRQIKPVSVKRLFYNYFLLHDFFQRLCNIKPISADFFDMQYETSTTMIKASKNGGLCGLLGTFCVISWHFFRSKKIKTKLLLGFLYGYWGNHIYTFGSYTGVLLVMPGVFRKVNTYFVNHPEQPDYAWKLAEYMDTDFEQTQPILKKIFPQNEQNKNSYVSNDFFQKNRQKYLGTKDPLMERQSFKLKYLDCFITRYVYYSFTRWFDRLQKAVGISS